MPDHDKLANWHHLAARKHPLSVQVEALRLLSAGKLPGEVCRVLEVPRGTLEHWKRAVPGYADAYAHAIRAGAAHLAGETVEIADGVTADRDEVNKARLRVAARQWLAARFDPDSFGDRQRIDQRVEVEVRRARFRSLLGDRRIVEAEARVVSNDATGEGEGEPEA